MKTDEISSLSEVGLEVLGELAEGTVVEVDVIIDTSKLDVAYEWGAMKKVLASPVVYRGKDALIKMYREPRNEDQPITTLDDDVGEITIFPVIPGIEEPPLGTRELSEHRATSYRLAKQYLGDFVPDTAFFIARDGKGKLRNWEIQARVHGRTMLEAGSLLPHMEGGEVTKALELIRRIEKMFLETGHMPDLHSDILQSQNVVISLKDGGSYLVDTDGQLEVDAKVVHLLKGNGGSLMAEGKLHPDINHWMETTDSIEARRCKESLQTTLDSLERAKKYLKQQN